MSAEIQYRDLRVSDISAIAKLHQKCFPESLMTRLGSVVLKAYYEWQWQAEHPFMKAQGAFLGEKLVGFCFSGVFQGATGGFIKKNARLLFVSLVFRPWLFFHGEFLEKIISGFKIYRKKKIKSDAESVQPGFGILSVATDPEYRGSGIGRRLLAESERDARSRKFRLMTLTVHPHNQGAVSFYEKQGWQKVSRADMWRGEMKKILIEDFRGS